MISRSASTFYTQCGGCLSIFRLDQRHLLAAGGKVRCGVCGEVFDAVEVLYERLPAELGGRSSTVLGAPWRSSPRRAMPAHTRREPSPAHRAEPNCSLVDSPTGPTASSRPAPPLEAVSEWHVATALELDRAVESPARRESGIRWGWFTGCVLLVLLGAAQLAWYNRAEIARSAALRPWLTQTCDRLGCDLPPMRRLAALAVVERKLRTHPDRDDALLLTAVIANRADEAQPWPQLGVILYAMNGEVMGHRWFAPMEYMEGESDDSLMMPGKHYAIRVAFHDPGSGAENFQLRFR